MNDEQAAARFRAELEAAAAAVIRAAEACRQIGDEKGYDQLMKTAADLTWGGRKP